MDLSSIVVDISTELGTCWNSSSAFQKSFIYVLRSKAKCQTFSPGEGAITIISVQELTHAQCFNMGLTLGIHIFVNAVTKTDEECGRSLR